jgi:alpha-tubulin suppressor-like RCC1 family protein
LTSPSNSGGSAITGYRVQNTATSNICYAAANQRSCIVKAVPGQRATFEVVTTTANGYSLPRVTAATVARYAPTQLAGGGASSCARLANGAVRCWGANTDGQLGVGSISAPRAPQDVPGLGHIAAVTAGGAFTCAITDTTVQRQVRCWGRNSNGQLGNGTLARSTRPAPVTTSTGARLVNAGKIAAGATFACAVISPGSTGRVQCWGANAKGQLGDGSTTQRTHPVTVKTSATTTLLGAIDVAAGGNTACALLSSGAVRCWGANGSGQLGNGATIDSRYAVPVKGLDGIHAKSTQLAVGDAFGCIRLTDGTARCWGANGDGQLGDSSKVQRKAPVKVNQWGTTLAHIGSIAAGGAHACATSSTNGGFYVLCWGRNASGELGLGSGSPAAHPDPGWAAFTGTTPQVACGAAHTLVVAAGNQPLLQAWGANSGLQLGVAGTAHRTSPVPVTAV